MRVVHLCLSCFYIDGFGYQENELVRQHVKEGHEVWVLASTETYDEHRRITYIQPADYIGSEGARVIRLPYRGLSPHFLMRKLRVHIGVAQWLEHIRPDVILFHGLCGWELRTAAMYKARHPGVRLYADSHEDRNNSARTFLSKYLLHRLYYRAVLTSCLPQIEKILCISLETIDFVRSEYGVPSSQLEFYPLGGHIFDDAEYADRRQRGRTALRASESEVLILQTGKMGRKKLLLEALAVFNQVQRRNLRLVLAGSIEEEIYREAVAKIEGDSRISFVGWKSSAELQDLLCAADVYLQPGSQSATMQMSLCARCPVILANVPSHQPFVSGNGWLISNANELEGILAQISSDPALLQDMCEKSLAIARQYLDYRVMAQRICN